MLGDGDGIGMAVNRVRLAPLVELGQVAAADMPPDAALIDESFLPPR